MKKSYAIIAFAAIAVLSCTKNEVIPSPDTEQAEDYVFTLTASVDPELTKTSYLL